MLPVCRFSGLHPATLFGTYDDRCDTHMLAYVAMQCFSTAEGIFDLSALEKRNRAEMEIQPGANWWVCCVPCWSGMLLACF